MAAELEKLARELAMRGYLEAALHFQKEATDFKHKGLIPDAITVPGSAEATPHELAIRVTNLADFLSHYPRQHAYFTSGEHGISLMTEKHIYPDEGRQTTLYSSSGWLPTDLGDGGIAFEANIDQWRRNEVNQLGVNISHVVAIGEHTEERSRERALAWVAEGRPKKFETDYYIGENGDIVKFSLMPIQLDLRPDIFNHPIKSLGLKRVRADVTSQDLQLIDKILYIFETTIPEAKK